MSKIEFNPVDHPHRRYNPRQVSGYWSHHTERNALSGADENPAVDELPRYDEKCFLCPTNERISGDVNPDYQGRMCLPMILPL